MRVKLAGGGELGTSIRSRDWSRTALGPIETWPLSLLTIVRLMLGSGSPMLLMWGPDLLQLYNDAFRPILGVSKHPRALGGTAKECWTEAWHVIGPLLRGVLETGRAVAEQNMPVPLQRHGYLEEAYFTFSYDPICDEDGSVAGVLVICEETTEQVLHERRLRLVTDLMAHTSRAKTVSDVCQAFHAVVTTSGADIAFFLLYLKDGGEVRLACHGGLVGPVHDDTRSFAHWESEEVERGGMQLLVDVAPRLAGWARQEGVEPCQQAIVIGLRHPGPSQLLGYLVAGLRPRRAVDDDYRSFLAVIAGQLAASIVNARAYEEAEQRAREASRSLAHAERATRLRDETLAVVSHDLRTPLGAISSAAETLESFVAAHPNQDAIRKRVDVIRRAVERMSALLLDLLDVASLEAGTLSLHPQAHPTESVLQALREMFEGQASERGVRFVCDAEQALPPVHCDRDRLLQALGNLVTNAIKFTPAGGQVRVGVRFDERERALQFHVQDTGPGIAADAREHIFERHWHAQQTQRQGHGLGLAIAKGIVDRHGGRLGVQSTLGAGSTFTVTLPIDAQAELSAESASPVPSFLRLGGEAGELIRAFDWSTTSLGPSALWPQSLKTSVSTMLRSPYPIILFWGRDHVMLYNDPFRPILGEKHPGTVGAYARYALVEAWEILGPLIANAQATGEPLFVENGLVMFARRPGGLKEESYFTWSYNPTIGEDGEIAGLFAIASETTRQVIGDRRLGTLRELSLRTAYDRTVSGVFGSLNDVLAQAAADVPFVLLYVVEGDAARLVSSTGLAPGASAAPSELPLESALWPIAAVARSGQEQLVEQLEVTHGKLPSGPWTEPVQRALLLPVPMGADLTGVLVAGLSPVLELDDTYRSFLQLLARQISASIASARAYEEESQRAAKLAELDRAKTDFFSNVSHEFRTPLTLILGPVEQALMRPDASLASAELELVRRNALRLHKMVNSLLDFSRVEAGRAQARFAPTDLAAYTENLASHFRSAAESAGLALQVDCALLPEPIYLDHEMWEKIVFNLLSNAVKFTHRGRIRVALGWREGSAVLRVEDTGVGIAAHELPHVFERFYRVHESAGRSHEGTGIGLALARELVALHGGTLSVTSELGVGTAFEVVLPSGYAHLPTARIESATEPRASSRGAAAFVEEAARWSGDTSHGVQARAASEMPSALTASRILLVDDNADLRSYVANLLGQVFTNVETATNGSEALALIQARAPDLVLSDVTMPIMDGFALVRALRSDERLRSIPIILLSARAGDESTVEGLASGADDYLVKPFTARELLARVRVLLEMSRVRAQVWSERGQVEVLRRSIAARDEFISVSSHELRTPLTALRIQIESLLRWSEQGRLESNDGRVADKLASSLRQVVRLTTLVQSLLDASRASLGALTLTEKDVDLGALVRDVVARTQGQAHAVGSRIQVRADAVRGWWDEARLIQVLGDLLANAIKYAPDTIIEVDVRQSAERARLVVRDRGMGIPEDARVRVFERYERAVSVEHYGGFGLGLYMSRKIVEAHGGSIAAERTDGGGTTIVVELPLLQLEPMERAQ
ncbi:MAG TPA: ATP-binding protein [Polyangiales bacterium]|nr:ATP-binding protein [Polyangiales bacterium]